jgi:uncharacterized membrane protein/GNAT superfamily N-acetyltransferase
VRLINEAYRVEEFFLHGQRTSEADVRERLMRPGASFLVLEESAEIIGAIFVQVNGPRGFFAMLAVAPFRQQQGVGRKLVYAAEEHCRAAGCKRLDLDVVDLRLELPSFYAKLGYAPYDTASFPEPAKLKRPARLTLMTKALTLAFLMTIATACRDTKPVAIAPPPAAAVETAPAAGATWDPWEDARSRGIEFRAVGNEPGWYLEIDNQKWMRLLYAYGEKMATVPVPASRVSGDHTSLASSGGGHAMQVEISPGPCSDGMSDQTYPLQVSVVIDGTDLSGCGRWLK